MRCGFSKSEWHETALHILFNMEELKDGKV